ncbi:MAG: hypothetical protein A2054_02015 [Deltaproteobacteria bacterium GWA2_55_10]|nr:MAG: hypothetical protein A2054_02015 [Deltaproteobacteria bacterium GWA2_55_10]
MKKFLFGLVIGIVALGAFLYFGGPKYLKLIGSKTEQAGERLEKYERSFKHTADEAKEAASDTAETVKEKAGSAKESIGYAIDKARKTVERANENTEEKSRESDRQ